MRQDRVEVSGAVAHLVVRVHLAALQQDEDVGQQVGAGGAKVGQRRDGGGAHGRILQDDAVVDEANVFGGLLGARTLLAEQVQNAHGQARVLAVFDELAQVRQTGLFGVGIVLDDGDDRVGDRGLVLEAALVAQHRRQEAHQDAVLARELEAERANGLDHHHLELVRDLRDEGGDLLHQPVDRRLAARLQQRRDGQRGDRAVRVRDQVLQVHVAGRHGRRVRHGHLVQRPHGRETQHRFQRRAVQLQHRHGRRQFARPRRPPQVHDGVRRLVHHLRPSPENGFFSVSS